MPSPKEKEKGKEKEPPDSSSRVDNLPTTDPTTPTATATATASNSRFRRTRNYPSASYGYYSSSVHPFAYAPHGAFFYESRRHRERDRDRDRDRDDGPGQEGSELRSGGRAHGRSERRHGHHRRDKIKDSRRRSRHRKKQMASTGSAEDGALNIPGAMKTRSATEEKAKAKAAAEETHFPFVMREERISLGDVKMQSEKRWALEQSNRESLSNIAAESTDFTRRLDATFYDLLQNASNLRTAITSFEELTNLASDLQTDFTDESAKLEHDHAQQIAGFNHFEPHVRGLESLEGRMQRAREKALALDKRMEAAREKTDAWNRRELEWQTRVTRRLRILWAAMGTVALLFAAYKFVQLIRPAGAMEYIPTAMVNGSEAHQAHGNSTVPSYVEVLDVRSDKEESFGLESCNAHAQSPVQTTPVDPDPLRILDEL